MIYEFECIKCKKLVEKEFKSFKEKVTYPTCPECGAKTKKIISKNTFKITWDTNY